MLKDSYDAKGIKFAVVVSTKFPKYSEVLDGTDSDAMINVVKETVSNDFANFIDFDNFDGLTIGEVLKIGSHLQAKSTIVFVSYTGFETTRLLPKMVNLGDVYIDFIRCTDENRNTPIEEFLAQTYLQNDCEKNEPIKNRNIKCFLQRYIFGTKEITDATINEYIK